MGPFVSMRRVEFSHCDPAGIVFYPRYFEMINSVVEEWFDRVLDWNFHDMHVRDGLGVPAVHIDVDFQSPSPLGDDLEFTLQVHAVGTASLRLGIDVGCREEQRLAATLTVVQMQLTERKSVPWAADLRARLEACLLLTCVEEIEGNS